MSTEKATSSDERACPFCAETIKSAAIVCKHCKRDLPQNNEAAKEVKTTSVAKEPKRPAATPEISAENIQKQRSATNQKTWGIILVVLGVLSLISGDFSIGKFLFFIVAPLAVGIWLIRKAVKLKASIPELPSNSKSDSTSQSIKTESGVTSQAEAFTKLVSEKSKAFFSVKKNLYISLGAFFAILALIVGLGIKSNADEQARAEKAAVAQAEQDKAQAAQKLAAALEDGQKLIATGNARFDESVAWSNDKDRGALKTAITNLETSIKSKKYDSIIDSSSKVTAALLVVGTQAEATARAEAAAKAEAAKAEAARKASETMGQKNATAKAKSYLSYSAFSRQGLIEQLEFEGYSTEDATYGTDYSGANWSEQAVKKGASYLKYTAFSSQGLYEQLIYEGFTPEEAQYGVSQNGY